MDLAQKKHLRKAYLPTLTPKCLGLSKYLNTELVYVFSGMLNSAQSISA